MSPSSQVQRKYNQKVEKKSMKRKIERYNLIEVPLDDQQSDEMDSLVSKIDAQCVNELESIFNEGIMCMHHTCIYSIAHYCTGRRYTWSGT